MAFDTTHDIVPDSPTNVFATLNPLLGTSNGTFNDGNLKITTTANGTMNAGSTISIPHTKKWYIEFVLSPTGIVGISKDFTSTTSGTSYGLNEEGRIYINGTDTTGVNSGRSWTSGDIISLLIDPSASSNNLSWYKNGTTSNDLIHQVTYDLTTASFFVITSKFSSSTYINFGQDHTFGGYPNSLASSSGYSDANGIGKFYYDPPTGALALCTANLPDPAIDPAVDDLPEDYMKAVIYTGDATNGVSKNIGFQPDLIWAKARSTAYNHIIIDSLRPHSDPNSYYRLHPDLTNAEANYSDNIYITSNGFNCAAKQSGVNENSQTFVAWCFRAGGNENTFNWGDGTGSSTYSGIQSALSLPASSTSGMITPSGMSVNTKAGFSIVKYNGTGTSDDVVYSIPHGLSSAPDMVIVKNLDLGSQSAGLSWPVLFKNIGGIGGLDGTSTASSAEVTNNWGGAYPTANVFTVKRPTVSSLTNRYRTMGAYNYIAYCWHSVAGYSAFGSYIGNGSPDGPFVYTGFKPAFVMIKNYSGGDAGYSSWYIADSARSLYNPSGGSNTLWANALYGEGKRGDGTSIGSNDYLDIDILSNGFKVRGSSNAGEIAKNSANYIYAAFAEQSTKYATAR